MVSFVDDAVIEVATVGLEGFVGIPIVLGEMSTSGRVFCQIPGSGYNIPGKVFEALLPQCPELHRLCLRYTSCVFDQAGQNSACNRVHTIEERCAKWLLLSHNRCQSDKFDLTQKFLAQMLGVRRQSVNLAAGALQHSGLIRYSRGHIEVLDRKGLEEVTCECYSVITGCLKKFTDA
jgi:CRP-like cAMP-binding protein